MSWFSDWWASVTKPIPTPTILPGWCVPDAIFCAMAWMIKNGPVRIIAQHIKPGEDHVQAEAQIDGQWHPLTEIWDGKSMTVQTWERHYNIEPYRYMTLGEFFNEQYEMFKKEAV